MRFFDELGATVAARWKQRDYNERWFPQAAMSALADLPPSGYTDLEEVVEDILTSDPMLFQADLGAEFGQPPFTVYWGRGFRIEVLFLDRCNSCCSPTCIFRGISRHARLQSASHLGI